MPIRNKVNIKILQIFKGLTFYQLLQLDTGIDKYSYEDFYLAAW